MRKISRATLLVLLLMGTSGSAGAETTLEKIARTGTLTITGSRADFIEGRFDIDAVGFEAAAPGDETRELVVRGAFTASPGARPGQ